MLRKRTRSIQKNQHNAGQMAISDVNHESYSQSHALGSNFKSSSIFNAPLVFVGMGPKGLLDSDSVKSPTSPLDFTFLSNIRNPFRTPRSLFNEGQQRSWDCPKVGLSIIDSLEESSKFSGKILRSSEKKKTSLSNLMITETPNCRSYVDSAQVSKSLPKDFCKLPYNQKGEFTVLFEIGETLHEHEPFGKTMSCSNLYSDPESFAFNQVSSPPHFIGGSLSKNTLVPEELKSNPVSASSSNEFIKSLSTSEIENSEDYTCVISHGPNPKTTHIFCDCILETHVNDVNKHYESEGKDEGLSSAVVKNKLLTPNQCPTGDFLSFCNHCNKKLEEGKDIYIYRGEKAFCSLSCRSMEIMIDEELEEFDPLSENSLKWEICETGIARAI